MNDIPTLLRFDSYPPNHWITIKIIGTRSNRHAIGARIYCVTGKYRQLDEVRSGGSYLSQNDLRIHFGLGNAISVDLLEVYWPSGIVEKFHQLEVDQLVDIKENVGVIAKKKISQGP